MEIPEDDETVGDNVIYKCRKCRHTLFRGDVVVNGHGRSVCLSPTEDDTCHVGGIPVVDAVWFLRDDSLPGWIETLVDEANWIKGKITCPKCHGKIGSFDFVNGTKCPCGHCVLPSAHIVKGKIDREDLCTAAPLQSHPVLVDTVEKQDTESTREVPETAASASPLHLTSVNQEAFFQMHDVSGMDGSGISKGKIRKPCRDISNYLKTKRRKDLDHQTKDPTAELEVPEELICAICLDIYHNPFICFPCTHVFCEICLRSLAKLDPEHTRCPLCRQYIGLCVSDSDRCQRTKSLYPKYYKARQTPLNKMRNIPLPWQAKYRLHQLSSRGLGHFWRGWQDNDSQNNVAQTVWESLSTVSILIALNVIALLTFLTGYYGCHYVPVFITWIFEGLDQIVNETTTSWWPF